MENDCGCGNSSEYVVKTNVASTCVNPLIYLLEPAIKASNGDLVALNTEIQSLLTEGLFLQNRNSLCCPDCLGDSSFYFLGNAASFQTFMTSYLASENFSDVMACCINYIGNLESSLDVRNLLNTNFTNDIVCCNNNFLDNLLQFVTEEEIVIALRDAGLIEIATFGSNSFLPVLKSKILEYYPYADDTFLSTVLNSILNEGVFIKCIDCGILITNASNAGESLDNFI